MGNFLDNSGLTFSLQCSTLQTISFSKIAIQEYIIYLVKCVNFLEMHMNENAATNYIKPFIHMT